MSSSFNLFDPAVRADPYRYYAALREKAAVAEIEPMGFLVTRYDEVVELLRSPERYSSVAMRAAMTVAQPEGDDEGPPPMVITEDPPTHTRLRSLLNRGFTPRRIGLLEPRIREIAAGLFAAIDARGECDLVRDLAVPLPVMVIAELLGVEPERSHDFKRWSQAVLATFGRIPDEAQRAASEAAFEELDAYIQEMVERRRREPRDDLISVLVKKEEEDALTSDELGGFVILLLIAGNETTTNLIGSTAIALTDHPDQLARVQADPKLLPNLVEEALRYTSPVQLLFRQTTRELELGGVKLPQGAVLLPCYAAANRDPRRFPDPDRFDVERDAQGHLAFGVGVHFCLGAGLARLEARVALEGLVPRLARLERCESEITWTDSPFVRGPKQLLLG